jgi:hypothetical protein
MTTSSAGENDAFSKLAKQFIANPGYYDPDTISLDTLSFEGGDALDVAEFGDDDPPTHHTATTTTATATATAATSSSAAAGGNDVLATSDLRRCHCCAARGMYCVAYTSNKGNESSSSKSSDLGLNGEYCVIIGDKNGEVSPATTSSSPSTTSYPATSSATSFHLLFSINVGARVGVVHK